MELDGDASGFQSRSAKDVLAGANVVLVEGELLQFRTAEIGDHGVLRLQGLLRGRFGTGYRSTGAPIGGRVFAIETRALPRFAVGFDVVGRDLLILANGLGDPVGGTASSYRIDGSGLAPLSPVHLRCERRPDGSIWSNWVQRHRNLWSWGAGPDPAAPDYVWRFAADDGRQLAVSTSGLFINLTLSDQQALLGGSLPAGSVRVEAVGEGPLAVRISSAVRI
jgi:hypothetical protein